MTLPDDAAKDAALGDLTQLIQDWRAGSGAAFALLIDKVYDELKRISKMRLARSGQAAISATELLHDALSSVLERPLEVRDRAHFFATMSLMMRSLLVDHARRNAAVRHGGNAQRLTLSPELADGASDPSDLLSIDDALSKLSELDRRCSQVMHLTYFAGMERDEVAELLGVGVRTVARDLAFGRAFVAQQLHHRVSP